MFAVATREGPKAAHASHHYNLAATVERQLGLKLVTKWRHKQTTFWGEKRGTVAKNYYCIVRLLYKKTLRAGGVR